LTGQWDFSDGGRLLLATTVNVFRNEL